MEIEGTELEIVDTPVNSANFTFIGSLKVISLPAAAILIQLPWPETLGVSANFICATISLDLKIWIASIVAEAAIGMKAATNGSRNLFIFKLHSEGSFVTQSTDQ